MTTCLLTKSITRQPSKLSSQLETIQEDLARLSGLVFHLTNLTDEELATLDISDQLDAIHRCLNRFETRCLEIKIASYEDEFAEPDSEETESTSQITGDWTTVRREAKRANKLASQLTNSLSKIRTGLGDCQNPGAIPEDIVRINQAVGNAINGLASDCLLDHG